MTAVENAIRRGVTTVLGAVADLNHQALALAGTVSGAQHPFQSGVHEPMDRELTSRSWR